eukprot:Hpha_TRINITY_DN15502_c0_g3::TRINITY_DN15502_c0_g3_i9::g.104988::m.104988
MSGEAEPDVKTMDQTELKAEVRRGRKRIELLEKELKDNKDAKLKVDQQLGGFKRELQALEQDKEIMKKGEDSLKEQIASLRKELDDLEDLKNLLSKLGISNASALQEKVESGVSHADFQEQQDKWKKMQKELEAAKREAQQAAEDAKAAQASAEKKLKESEAQKKHAGGQSDDELRKLRQRIAELETDLQFAAGEKDRLKKENAEQDKSKRELESAMREARRETEDAKDAQAAAERKLRSAEEQLKDIQREGGQQGDEMRKLRLRLDEQDREPKAAAAEKDKLNRELADLKEQHRGLQKKRGDAAEEQEGMSAELRKELEELRRAKAKCHDEHSKLAEEFIEAVEELNRCQNDLDKALKMKNEVDKLRKENMAAKMRIAGLKAQADSMRAELEAREPEFIRYARENAELREKLALARRDILALEKEVANWRKFGGDAEKMKNEVDKVRKESMCATMRISGLKARTNRYAKENWELRGKLDAAERITAQATSELHDSNKQFAEAKKEWEALAAELPDMTAKHKVLLDKYSDS